MELKKVYFLVKAMDACFYYRILNPAKYLERDYKWECSFDLIDDVFEQNYKGEYEYNKIKKTKMKFLEDSDLIVLQRGTDEGHLSLLRMLRYDLKKKVIYEADDDYICIPEWNSGYNYFTARKSYIEQMLREVDGVTVTVDHLADFYKQYNDNVKVLPNCIDFDKLYSAEMLSSDHPLIRPSKFCKYEDADAIALEHIQKQIKSMLKNNTPTEDDLKKIKGMGIKFNIPVDYDSYIDKSAEGTIIGWGGSPTHVMDIETVRKPLLKVMHKYRKVNLAMVGFLYMMKVLGRSPHGALLRKWILDLDVSRFWAFQLVGVKSYYPLMKSLNFDIGLAPVASVKFNKSKSPLKILEYMAFGAYPMATDFETYQGVMEKEGTINKLGRGRLCETEEDWENNLYEVLNDKDMREESVGHNRNFVMENYDMESHANKWNDYYRLFV